MKKIQIYFLICILMFYLIDNLSAQKIPLSVKSSITDAYKLYPKTVTELKWLPNINLFSYIKDNNKLIIENPFTSNKIDSLDLNFLNTIFFKNDGQKLIYFPSINWIDSENFYFQLDSACYFYNIKSKFKQYIQLPTNIENIDFCKNANMLAYTKDNNLYYVSMDNKIKAITSFLDKNIICGQIVSRNEFGIDKGTFWSPLGNFIAYYKKNESDVTEYPIVDVNSRIAKTKMIKYPMAGCASEHVSVGIYNFKNNQTIYIEENKNSEQYLTSISWDPSEKYIYIGLLNRDQNHFRLNKYNSNDGSFVKTLFEEKATTFIEPSKPLLFLNSHKDQFIWMSERDGFNHAYLYNTNGDLLKQLTKGKWLVTDCKGLDIKDQTLYYESTQASPIQRQLYSLDIKSNKTTQITSENGIHKTIVSHSCDWVIDSYSNLNTPGVIQTLNSKGKKIQTVISASNPLEEFNFGKITIDKIKSPDGITDLYYRMIKPINFDSTKKYPVIVYVYGGPHSQLVDNSWLANANLWMLSLSAKGFIVFTLDNRGTSFRGKDFQDIIHRQNGQMEMIDQMEGVNFLKSLAYVDQSRVGVHGWSYGGFMTTSLKVNFPTVFKVGVAGGPVIDWKFYETMYGERYMDTPEENPDGYLKTSLLGKAGLLKGKMLIIHGAQDPIVVWQHSLLFIEEAIKKNIDIDYFVYPNAEHNMRGRDRVHLMEKVIKYFEDNL